MPQIEALGRCYVLTELRETREVLERKFFTPEDLDLILKVDQLPDGNLVKLTDPIWAEERAVAFI